MTKKIIEFKKVSKKHVVGEVIIDALKNVSFSIAAGISKECGIEKCKNA